jgi:hypothetical protein
MARRGSRTRSLPSGTACRCSAALSDKHRNLLAPTPERLHDEISADYNDMIYAETRADREATQGLCRKWRLKHRAIADSLQEAGVA